MTTRIIEKIKRKFGKKSNKSFSQVFDTKYKKVSDAHDLSRQTIVIYQMGKVGSSTVKYSLSELALPMNIYHVHALTHERIKWFENTYQHASSVKGKAVIHDHVVESIFLRELMDNDELHDWKIIH